MTEESQDDSATMIVSSTRFGDLTVPVTSIIEFPSGVIGFPRHKQFIMIDHKPPFSWLQSVEESSLAFVVVDGFEFGQQYDLKLPFADTECDFHEEDEYAILVIVTVRADARLTSANLKAPVFVNIRNRRGCQVIYDDPRYSTRFPLWSEEEEPNQEGTETPAAPPPKESSEK